MSFLNAPWTDDQVASLNGFQTCQWVHPFTAGTRRPNGDEIVLIATRDGWIEEPGGPVVQTWAHHFMADWTWKKRAEAFDAAVSVGDEDTDPGS